MVKEERCELSEDGLGDIAEEIDGFGAKLANEEPDHRCDSCLGSKESHDNELLDDAMETRCGLNAMMAGS